jgi:CheY-like chemotaxis protein
LVKKVSLSKVEALKVLAVVDSHDNLTLISLYLENTPHKISYADSGKLAVQKFKEERFDVVLMDLQMPHIDGYTATAMIREWEVSMLLAPVPIIALFAHDLTHNQARFKEVGFTLQLVKPVDAQSLQRAIEETAGPAKQIANDTASRIQNLEKKLASMAPAYIQKRKQELVEIHRYVEALDFKSLQMVGHRLKGSAKTYNFAALGDIGAELEKAAEKSDLEQVKILVDRAEKFISQATC